MEFSKKNCEDVVGPSVCASIGALEYIKRKIGRFWIQ